MKVTLRLHALAPRAALLALAKLPSDPSLAAHAPAKAYVVLRGRRPSFVRADLLSLEQILWFAESGVG